MASSEPISGDSDAIRQAQSLLDGANWLEAFTDPFGRSAPVVFTRAWLILFLVVLLANIVGTVLAMAGAPAWTHHVGLVAWVLAVPFWGVIHFRRLNDAGKSPGWGVLVFLPLLVALLAASGAGGQQARILSGEVSMEASAGAEQKSADAPVTADKKKSSAKNNAKRGAPEKPQTALEVAIGAGSMVHLLLGVLVAIWSIAWVARCPGIAPEDDDREIANA